MTTATRTPRARTRAAKFLTLYPTDVRNVVSSITRDTDLKLVPSPTGSYARAGIHGQTIAYVVPGQRQVRILISPAYLPPAKELKRIIARDDARLISSGQLVISIRPNDDAGSALVTRILKQAAAQVPALSSASAAKVAV